MFQRNNWCLSKGQNNQDSNYSVGPNSQATLSGPCLSGRSGWGSTIRFSLTMGIDSVQCPQKHSVLSIICTHVFDTRQWTQSMKQSVPSVICCHLKLTEGNVWLNQSRNSPCFVDPRGYYYVHKSLKLVPVLSCMNLLCTLHTYFFEIISIVSSHLCLGVPNNFILSCFPTKILCTCGSHDLHH